MANDDDVVRLLASIDRRLALLTAEQHRDLWHALKDELLQGRGRTAMFEGIDGVRGSGELAKLGGVSERAAQLFINELLELGLVRRIPGSLGRAVIVERDETAITDWYLQRNTKD